MKPQMRSRAPRVRSPIAKWRPWLPTSKPATTQASGADVSFGEFQQLIRDMYMEKDVARGVDGTFMWLIEEVGELASSLREGTLQEQSAEFADVLAWLTSIANVVDVDLSAAVLHKYGQGCPGCGHLVVHCIGRVIVMRRIRMQACADRGRVVRVGQEQ